MGEASEGAGRGEGAGVGGGGVEAGCWEMSRESKAVKQQGQ